MRDISVEKDIQALVLLIMEVTTPPPPNPPPRGLNAVQGLLGRSGNIALLNFFEFCVLEDSAVQSTEQCILTPFLNLPTQPQWINSN